MHICYLHNDLRGEVNKEGRRGRGKDGREERGKRETKGRKKIGDRRE